MLFSKNPRVVVVDDKEKEVKVLLETFAREGFSCVHLDGGMECVSEQQCDFSEVRLLIFDIDLEGRSAGSDDKSTASADASLIEDFIVKGAPYYLLFWTKRTEVCELIIKCLKEDGFSPVDYDDMEKPTDIEMNNLTSQDILQRFQSKTKNSPFEYLVKWEDEVHKSAARFINEISSVAFSMNPDRWTDGVKRIFTQLCCTYTGHLTKSKCKDKECMNNATTILKECLYDSIPSEIDVAVDSLPKKAELPLEAVAELNTKLFIEKNVSQTLEYGSVFLVEKEDGFFQLLKEKVKKRFPQEGLLRLIGTILTPPCDLAQKKYLYNEDVGIHRVLYGLCIEIGSNGESLKQDCTDISSLLERYKKDELDKEFVLKSISPKKSEAEYTISPFYDEKEKLSIIIFFFGTLSANAVEIGPFRPIFKLKEKLAFDLQSKLANHVNRLGNSMLES